MGVSIKGVVAVENIGESVDEESGVGEFRSRSTSVVTMKGGLCGNGDMSMASIAGAGDDEGSGGVVMASSIWTVSTHPASMRV